MTARCALYTGALKMRVREYAYGIATFPKFLMAVYSDIDPVNVRAKFEIRTSIRF